MTMSSETKRPLIVLGLAVICLGVSHATAAQEFDILIRGGRLLDGTGNPWVYADIGISRDMIVAVGRLRGASGARVIDARGKTVVPGFIDLHSHADGPNYGGRGLRSEDPRRRAAPNLVAQGITTVVVNQDGRSLWPIAEQRAALIRNGVGTNVALLVGHGTVRRMVMGDDYQRVANPSEVEKMRALVRQGMEEGAYGLSSGLEYVPGRWSDTEEVAALVSEIVPFGGVYITHERASGADPMWYLPSQGGSVTTMLDAIVETIQIAERTGVTAVQSHIKARGSNYWGSSYAAIQLIERARARGVDIWADQYPYNTTGSDGSTVLIPSWVWERSRGNQGERGSQRRFADALRAALADPGMAAQIRRDVTHEIARRGGPGNILVMQYPNPAFVGKTIAQLADETGSTATDIALRLQLEGDQGRPGGAGLRGFSLSEYDVEAYARMPWVATATDGWIALPEDGLTHVRIYGSYPRKIKHYAMDRGVLSVEDAVRSSTWLPAQIVGLSDRGMIAEGMQADVVILDLDALRDNATFFEPHQYPTGVEFVLVNGEFVVDGGRITGAMPGRVITNERVDPKRPSTMP